MKVVFIKGPKSMMGEDIFVINKGQSNEKHIRCISGNCECYDMRDITNEPNVREVNEKAPVIPKIISTLAIEPDKMVMRNGGITIVASSFEYDRYRGAWKIVLNEGDGIINGGHTKYAIREALRQLGNLNGAKVPVRILESSNLSDEDVAEISSCLNDSCSPRISTLAEKRGLTKNIKEALRPEYSEKIEWKENTKEGKDFITLDELLMLFNLMDIRTYGYHEHDKNKTITKSVNNIAKKFNEESLNYDYLAPIMNDILELADTINASLTRVASYTGKRAIKDIGFMYVGQIRQKQNQSNFVNKELSINEKYTIFTNEAYMYEVKKAFLYVILSAFRANLTFKNNKVCWVIPNVCDFYRSIESEIWRSMVKNTAEYVETKDGKSLVDASASTKPKNAIWSNIYDVVDKQVYKAKSKLLKSA